MKIGYSFWGFLGDYKFTKNDGNVKLASTPDGNAFYSWAIMDAFVSKGDEVIQVMPDRDRIGYDLLGDNLFNALARDKRSNAYRKSVKSFTDDTQIRYMDEKQVFDLWVSVGLDTVDIILHEWRMEIPGRNTGDARDDQSKYWQPDLFLQKCLIDFAIQYDIPFVVFDLDYKLDVDTATALNDSLSKFRILELGVKWGLTIPFCLVSHTVDVPFDFNVLNESFEPGLSPTYDLVYVGNRYERDWCIDKYIKGLRCKVKVYGNWLEGGRDSAEVWPSIEFGHRLQTAEMPGVYRDALVTPLLAKREYCEYGFMTARYFEALMYGTVPLFIGEFQSDVTWRYAGVYSKLLTVDSVGDIENLIEDFTAHPEMRVELIKTLRKSAGHLMTAEKFRCVIVAIVQRG